MLFPSLDSPQQAGRRHFFRKAANWFAGSSLLSGLASVATPSPQLLRPPALEKGQTIGLITPASSVADHKRVDAFAEFLQQQGFGVKYGKHVFGKHGYLAGTDEERSGDLNSMFADPEVDAIIAVRGGWGGARMLGLLDYETIRKNPKILLGYSDVTSLLLAIHAKTGLITFHGPVGLSEWNRFTFKHFRKTVMKGRQYKLKGSRTNPQDPVTGRYTITPGKAEGKLLGGNLSVLCGMVGSDYLPDFKGSILLLEDVGEAVYRIDRYLTQLQLAGILSKVSGVVFSSCNDCRPEIKSDQFTLREILYQHLAPLGIPVFFGTKIGHIDQQYTLPIGTQVSINAKRGFIRLETEALA